MTAQQRALFKTQLLSRSARTNQSALDRFGDSVQDVMAAIGAPSKVFPFKLSFEISFESNVSGFLQIGGQDEDPLPKRASPLCCAPLRLFLQLLHDGDGRTTFQTIIINFWGNSKWDNFRTFSLMRRTIKSRNSFCTPTFPATTTSTCKNHNRSVIITKDITMAS